MNTVDALMKLERAAECATRATKQIGSKDAIAAANALDEIASELRAHYQNREHGAPDFEILDVRILQIVTNYSNDLNR